MCALLDGYKNESGWCVMAKKIRVKLVLAGLVCVMAKVLSSAIFGEKSFNFSLAAIFALLSIQNYKKVFRYFFLIQNLFPK